jgi:hypothetical protein
MDFPGPPGSAAGGGGDTRRSLSAAADPSLDPPSAAGGGDGGRWESFLSPAPDSARSLGLTRTDSGSRIPGPASLTGRSPRMPRSVLPLPPTREEGSPHAAV